MRNRSSPHLNARVFNSRVEIFLMLRVCNETPLPTIWTCNAQWKMKNWPPKTWPKNSYSIPISKRNSNNFVPKCSTVQSILQMLICSSILDFHFCAHCEILCYELWRWWKLTMRLFWCHLSQRAAFSFACDISADTNIFVQFLWEVC